MLQIIFAFVGLRTLIKGKINFSTTRELIRPKATYVGISFLLTALILLLFFDWLTDIVVGTVFLIVVFVVTYFSSQDVASENILNKYSRLKILWLVLLLPAFFIAPFSGFMFDSPDSSKDLVVIIIFLGIITSPASLLIGAIAGHLNQKNGKDYIAVYLPFLNLCIVLIPIIIASVVYIVNKII